MKILVPIKRVIDHTVTVRVKNNHNTVNTENVKMSINPFDAHALEEALHLKDTGKAKEVIVVTIGGEKAQEQLRTALAMGADRAILIQTDKAIDAGGLEPLDVAKRLQTIAQKEEPTLIIMGKQSIDSDAGQTPQILAGLLGWGQGTFTSSLTLLEEGDEDFEITREIDGGLETLRLKAPTVLSVDLRLNTPRYAKLPDIIKAKKKPLEITTDITPKESSGIIELLSITEPPTRKPGIKVKDVDDLLDKLKNEAKVI